MYQVMCIKRVTSGQTPIESILLNKERDKCENRVVRFLLDC